MAELKSVETDFLTCSMCFEVFEEPKILSCLHRFCECCLHNWIIGSHTCTKNGHTGFKCPICREFIEMADSSKSPSEWASLIRTDFHIKSLVSFVDSRRKITKYQHVPRLDHPCHPHTDQGCDLYCVDCSKAMCHLCAGVSHRRCNKVLTLHEAAAERKAKMEVHLKDVIQKRNEAYKMNSSLEISMSRLKLRKRDAETEVRKWSQNMRQSIVSEENKLLEQIRNGFAVWQGEVASNVNQFKAKLQKDTDLFEALSSKITEASNFDLMCDNSVAEMVKECERCDIFVANGFEEFIQKLSDLRIHVEIKPQSSDPIISITFINDASNSSSCAASSSENVHAAQSMEILCSARHIKSPEEASSMTLEPDSQTRHIPIAEKRRQRLSNQEAYNSVWPVSYSYLNSQVLVNKSQVGAHTKANFPQLSVALDREELNGMPWRRADATKQFLQVTTIDTRVEEDDRFCDLRDLIVVCHGNIIVVTDWANQNVKAFDTRRATHARLNLEDNPWAITHLTDNLAAISLPLSQEICIIEISSLLKIRQRIVTVKSYFGLAALDSTCLAASSVLETSCVDIINLKGEVLKSFTNDHTGNHMFAFPAYINVTADGNILISDESIGALICMSQNGETKFIYKPEDRYQFHEARGVSAHCSGRILVAKSQGLLALTEEGQFENILVKPQNKILLHPRGLTQDESGLVYVTDKGQVHIFQYNTNATNENQGTKL